MFFHKILIFSLFSFLMCKNKSQELKDSVMFPNKNHLIEISDCGVKYNKKNLEFGSYVKDWISILGPYSRISKGFMAEWGSFIYDSIGLEIGFNDSNKVESLKVYFMNLDDSVAKKGFLKSLEPFLMKKKIKLNTLFHLKLLKME